MLHYLHVSIPVRALHLFFLSQKLRKATETSIEARAHAIAACAQRQLKRSEERLQIIDILKLQISPWRQLKWIAAKKPGVAQTVCPGSTGGKVGIGSSIGTQIWSLCPIWSAKADSVEFPHFLRFARYVHPAVIQAAEAGCVACYTEIPTDDVALQAGHTQRDQYLGLRMPRLCSRWWHLNPSRPRNGVPVFFGWVNNYPGI